MRKIMFLIFVLLQSPVFSQQKIENITSITLHKVYDIPDDSGGNPFIYPDSQYYSTSKISIKKCDSLVLKLIDLKLSLKKRKSFLVCNEKYCPVILYMVSYQFNGLRDTLYFDSVGRDKLIIDYKNNKEYEDTENEFFNILSKNKLLKDCYLANLDSLHREMFSNRVLDSVNVNEIKINQKEVYGLKFEQFEKVVDSLNYYKKEYSRNGYGNNGDWELDGAIEYKTYLNSFYFSENRPINKIIVDDGLYVGNINYGIKSQIAVLGLKVGDDEKLVTSKFPKSTQFIQNQKKYFTLENGDYSINVSIENDKGNIEYILNNRKIIKIIVSFYYRKIN